MINYETHRNIFINIIVPNWSPDSNVNLKKIMYEYVNTSKAKVYAKENSEICQKEAYKEPLDDSWYS